MFSVLLPLFTSNSLGCGELPVDMNAVQEGSHAAKRESRVVQDLGTGSIE
jgi:hypothetical protein